MWNVLETISRLLGRSTPTQPSDAIEVIYDRDKGCRLKLFQYHDGMYGYEEEFYADDDGYECWLPRAQPASRFATPELARREALSGEVWANAMLSDISGRERSDA